MAFYGQPLQEHKGSLCQPVETAPLASQIDLDVVWIQWTPSSWLRNASQDLMYHVTSPYLSEMQVEPALACCHAPLIHVTDLLLLAA